MSGPNIEHILSRATENLRKLIEEAFESGRAAERESMLAILSHPPEPSEFTAARILAERNRTLIAAISQAEGEPHTGISDSRAPSGTVKPRIKALIESAKDGISYAEITEKTGFKENSVRGTLSALKTEGYAEIRHGKWFKSQGKGSLTTASGPPLKLGGS